MAPVRPCCADRRRGCPVLDTVIDMPLVVLVVFVVLKTVEVPQLQYLDKVVDVFFVQFMDGCGRPSAHAGRCSAVLGQGGDMPVVVNDRCLEVPQVQFLWLWTSL